VVPAGLRSELLRRRPDIRRAERELAAATADIGAAIADLYPSFELTAAGAFSASDGASLFDAGSFARVLGASVRWPVFRGGRIRARIDAEQARAREVAIRYEQTILRALEEVETGLVGYARQRVVRERLERAAGATAEAADLARRLYRTGLGDFLEVLDAERELTETQDERVRAATDAAVRLVALYKALGGGWPAPGGVRETTRSTGAALPRPSSGDPASAPSGGAG